MSEHNTVQSGGSKEPEMEVEKTRPCENHQGCSTNMCRCSKQVGLEDVTVQYMGLQLLPPHPTELELSDEKRKKGHL